MRAVHVVITGRVQGVGYRSWCAREANRHGLSGWIRNRKSGEVEIVFSGSDASLEQVLAICAVGPGFARVDEVKVLGRAAQVSGPFDIVETV
ncbi:MAG: acylphosphatase [Stappiaceae bacterium]